MGDTPSEWLRHRSPINKIFKRRHHSFAIASISATVIVSAAFIILYWLDSAKLSQVNPLAYLRYPISTVKTFRVSSAESAQLADLSFSPESEMLFAAAIAEANPTEAPLTQQPQLFQPGVRAISFRDYKMKSSVMAANDSHSVFITVGESRETNDFVAHVWAYVPASLPEGTLYTTGLMKLFSLEPVTDVHVAMDGRGERFVIAAQTETTPKLWIGDARSRGADISPGEFTYVLTLESPAIAVTFSPDGQTFVTAHTNDTAYLWDSKTGEQIRQLNYSVPSPPRDNWKGQVIFSADGRLIAMVDASAIYLWEAKTGRLLNTFTLTNEAGTNIWGHTRSLAISSNNQWIASDAGHSNKIYFWNTQSGELLRVLRSRYTDAIAFSSNDQKFASGNQSTHVTLWKLPEQLR